MCFQVGSNEEDTSPAKPVQRWSTHGVAGYWHSRQSKQGNKYILIAADYFTKWVETYPLVNQEAVTVAEVLIREFISRFGVPLSLILHFDQGRNFESAVFSEMCKLLWVAKTRTTPLNTQSDGMVEHFNRTLEAQLSGSPIRLGSPGISRRGAARVIILGGCISRWPPILLQYARQWSQAHQSVCSVVVWKQWDQLVENTGICI